jgi:hypothetical protein
LPGYCALVSQFLSYEENFNSAGLSASSGYDNLVTNTVGRKAVAASSGMETGSIPVQTLGVGRGSNIAYSAVAVFYIGYQLIHTHHQNNVLGAVN